MITLLYYGFVSFVSIWVSITCSYFLFCTKLDKIEIAFDTIFISCSVLYAIVHITIFLKKYFIFVGENNK